MNKSFATKNKRKRRPNN